MDPSTPRNVRALYAGAFDFSHDQLDELQEVHAAVRTAVRERGLIPAIDHRFQVRDDRVWVLTRASGQPIAGTVVDGSVILERVDRSGNHCGLLA